MVLLAAEVCEEKKGTDIRILELDPMDSGLTDYFLIASATNTRQTGAIADEIELKMKREFGQYARAVEGRRTGEWILLDYTDFVAHIFTEQTRAFYDIERLRKSARPLDARELAGKPQRKARGAPPADGELVIEPVEVVMQPAKKAAKKSTPKKAGKKAVKKTAAKKAAPKKAAKKAASNSVMRGGIYDGVEPIALPGSVTLELPPPEDE